MAKKKLTINQQQWKKEMERIERFQRSASKRGFYFPDDILPQQPKRITRQAIKKLANLTPEEQYAKAVYLDRDTGKIIPGSEGRKQERSEAAKKGWQTRKYKATPRPKPQESGVERPDEPIIDTGSDEPIFNGGEVKGGFQPFEVNSLILAMDRAIEELWFIEYPVIFDYPYEIKLLQSVWNSTKERFKDHKYVLEEHISNNDVELQFCLNTIKYGSGQKVDSVVRHALNRLIELLNYNEPLSTEQLKEFESEYTDIDLTDIDLPYIDE